MPPAGSKKTPRKKYSRNTRGLAPERLMVIDQMLRQCLTHGAIAALCAKNWGLSERQIHNYIRAVYVKWEEDAKKTLVDRTWLRRSQLEGVLETAMQMKPPDLRVAVAALDRLCKVDGVYAPLEVHAGVSATVETRVSKMTAATSARALRSCSSSGCRSTRATARARCEPPRPQPEGHPGGARTHAARGPG